MKPPLGGLNLLPALEAFAFPLVGFEISQSLLKSSCRDVGLVPASQQFLVGPRFTDAASLQHHDEVSHANRREAVGHEKRHGAGHGSDDPGAFRVTSKEQMLAVGVEGRGGLVEHEEQRGPPHHGPS